MDIFNKNPQESEKLFLRNRMRAIFGSNEMLVHGIIKAVLALLFLFSGFSVLVSAFGCVFFAFSAASTFLMFSKMQGERKFSPIGAKFYSVFTVVEGVALLSLVLLYALFIASAMFGRSLFGTLTENAAILPYKMGLWCIPTVILLIITSSDLYNFFRYQRRFAENIYDCVDVQLVFYSTEKKYVLKCYTYALIVFIYNIFKLLCPSWYKLNAVPAKLAEYLDSGIIIEKYNAFTFIVLFLISAHFVFSGRLAAKYINVLRKLKKKINERHAS